MDANTNKIQKMIERALTDGRLSSQEDEEIKAAIRSDHQVTREEMKLYRELQQQIFEGEILIDD
ncbi:unknown [Crocosphaera subtropica ATCC 51142]|uniref:Uncharacterized protein n=1 Tax=Crocosphaera subtropica (strain ATCC 51142 / BH68) TaxID=43989 RepID=B1X0I9_CROS5|nr:hypothetical protein [Crocosphaera subtropica]ACB51278.1 unknown [Crocosphaera subtropica ATCC 51142]